MHKIKKVTKQFNLFLFSGVIATFVHYTFLFLAVELYSAGPVTSSTIGAILGAVTGYLLNARITFNDRKKSYKNFIRYMKLAVISATLNCLLMWVLVDYYDIYYIFSQILTTGILVFWNFILCHTWVYKEH